LSEITANSRNITQIVTGTYEVLFSRALPLLYLMMMILESEFDDSIIAILLLSP
jgi:hypothetical protein